MLACPPALQSLEHLCVDAAMPMLDRQHDVISQAVGRVVASVRAIRRHAAPFVMPTPVAHALQCALQSGVRLRCRPPREMVSAQRMWIGYQRFTYNAKVDDASLAIETLGIGRNVAHNCVATQRRRSSCSRR